MGGGLFGVGEEGKEALVVASVEAGGRVISLEESEIISTEDEMNATIISQKSQNSPQFTCLTIEKSDIAVFKKDVFIRIFFAKVWNLFRFGNIQAMRTDSLLHTAIISRIK